MLRLINETIIIPYIAISHFLLLFASVEHASTTIIIPYLFKIKAFPIS